MFVVMMIPVVSWDYDYVTMINYFDDNYNTTNYFNCHSIFELFQLFFDIQVEIIFENPTWCDKINILFLTKYQPNYSLIIFYWRRNTFLFHSNDRQNLPDKSSEIFNKSKFSQNFQKQFNHSELALNLAEKFRFKFWLNKEWGSCKL